MTANLIRTTSFITSILLAVSCQQSYAQLKIGKRTSVSFATTNEARSILTAVDEFVSRMSPFDRAARMKTADEVSQAQYLEFVGKNILEWSGAEKQAITGAFEDIQARLESTDLPFPDKIVIIKTTGKEEGGAAYTRANAIVLPKPMLAAPARMIQQILCHELFHIMSRQDSVLREKLYNTIGFQKCNEIPFPKELKSRKLTNPDAPKNDHCVMITVDNEERWAIPILYSNAEKYDTNRGGEFFSYLQFKLLLVNRDPKTSKVSVSRNGTNPVLLDVSQVSGFFEQIGNNTNYIIHPEEVLADNFSYLVLEKDNLPTPAIVKKMAQILDIKY